MGSGCRSSPLAGTTASPRRDTEASGGIEGRDTPGARWPRSPWELCSSIRGPAGGQPASEEPAEVAQLAKASQGRAGVPTPCNKSVIHRGVTGGHSCFSRPHYLTRAGLREPLLTACQEPSVAGGVGGIRKGGGHSPPGGVTLTEGPSSQHSRGALPAAPPLSRCRVSK